ncbi:MAG: hypothetical protein ABSH20_07165 [Tepidisphaeraceae bacterium]
MTDRLENAFMKASQLPEAAQEQLPDQLMEEISGEMNWDGTLAQSQDLLDEMARKALQARRDGHTRDGGFDQLCHNHEPGTTARMLSSSEPHVAGTPTATQQ